MDHGLLGKILASIATGAAVAGAITTNPAGVASNPEEISQIIVGFLSIWMQHPASGAVPMALKTSIAPIPGVGPKLST